MSFLAIFGIRNKYINIDIIKAIVDPPSRLKICQQCSQDLMDLIQGVVFGKDMEPILYLEAVPF